MAGFWDGYDEKTGKKKDQGREITRGDSIASFFSGTADAAASGLLRVGSGLVNNIATGFNEDEANKRTGEFLKSAGFRDDGTTDMSVTADPGARQAGAITGTVLNLPAAIAGTIVTDAGNVGATVGASAATALGIPEQTQSNYRKEIKSIEDLKSKILEGSPAFQNPNVTAPGITSYDSLSKEQKKLVDSLTDKIKDVQEKASKDKKYVDDKLDPKKFASNAFNTALNFIGIGEVANVIKGAKTAEETVNATSKLGKAAENLSNTKGGKVVDALINPQGVKQGAAVFGTGGAIAGGLQENADNPNANPLTIAQGAATGGALGTAFGAGVPALGEFIRKLKGSTPDVSTSRPVTSTVNDTASSSNSGTDISAFPEVTNTQVRTPNASNPTFDSQIDPTGRIALNQLGDAAESANPAGFFTKDVPQPKAKNMGAEITPGPKTEIVADLNLSPAESEAIGKNANFKTKPAKVEDGYKQTKADVLAEEKAANDRSLGENVLKDIEDRKGNVAPEVEQAASAIGRAAKDVAKDLTGAYRTVPGKLSKVRKDVDINFDNVTNNMSRMAGKTGSDVADKLQTGARFKSRFIDETKDYVDLAKDDTVKNLGVTEAANQVKRVREAIEKNNTDALKDIDQNAYKAAKLLFERAKKERIKQGRAVKEDYFTHANLQSDDNATGRVLDAIFGDSQDMTSTFSRKRTGEEAGDVPDMHTLLNKYQQGMANDLAFKDAFDHLKGNLKGIPAHLANDPKNMSEFKAYVKDLFEHAQSGSSENNIGRLSGLSAISNNFTDNVLRFNVGNAFKNFTDRIKTKEIISKEANKLKVNKDIMDEFEADGQNFTYGNSKIEDSGVEPSRSSKLGKALDVISPNTQTERLQVTNNAKKGLAEGFTRSEVYKQAKKDGLSDEAAQTKAWKEDREGIERTANFVSGTASAGNAMQQVSALRNGKPLLGGLVPWKNVSKFASYPINNTMRFIRNMTPNEARALEAYGRGDMAGATAADIRGGAKTLLELMENARNDKGNPIPKDVMDIKIQTIKDGINQIDQYFAKDSKISRASNVKTFVKIWAATTAIQMAVTGVRDGIYGTDKQKSPTGTALSQNPFLDVNRVVNPVVNGSPLQSDGFGGVRVDARGALNAVPVVGGIDTLLGSPIANWLNENVIKSVNKGIRTANS